MSTLQKVKSKISIKILILLTFFIYGNFMMFGEDVNFSFDFAFIKKNEVIPIKKNIALSDGDKFQLYIKAYDNVYCYIIYEDVQKKIIPFYHAKLEINTEYYFPGSFSYFQVEPPNGKEKFYIVISKDKISSIENSLSNNDNDKLIDDILRFKQEKNSFTDAPEKPAPMGGVSRGVESSKAVNYSGDSSYVKTIRFNH
ncbi:MAG: hypothetical protein B6229_04650 [Spirochaetaceae bacterium 4572_7]|nr:MAG: hypothetical protein B6229_04650 [Spirochaetaceae bacterium 4572_7]